MTFKTYFSNGLKLTFTYAGRALLLGLLTAAVAATGCDDDDPETNADAAVLDAGGDANVTDTNPVPGDASSADTGTPDSAAGDAAPGDAAAGDAAAGDAAPGV